jgi:prepilin-type N-terminal cleavage/methylation domain-containing protein
MFIPVFKRYASSKKYAGFTLIELLFVIAIIGILSTSTIFFYQQRMRNQKIEEVMTQIGRWAYAAGEYYTKNKHWPINVDILMEQGYMPKNAADSNPWCSGGGCYVMSPANETLMTITTTISASGGDAIRTEIAARLPYATKTNTAVVSNVNAPLIKKNQEMPEVILIEMRPFQIGPMSGSNFWISLVMDERNPDPDPSNIYASSLDGATYIGAIPSCSAYPSYSLVLYPVMSGYTTRYNRDDDARRNYFQQAVFSQLEVYTNIAPNGVNVRLRARPQRTFFKYEPCVWKGDSDCLPTEMASELIGEITVKGSVFFMCCKANTHCKPPNHPGAAAETPVLSQESRF